MIDSLLGQTTVVTEHRTYLIDKVGKKGVSRASVSARSSDVTQRDVEVTRTKPHVITRHSNKFLQIKTTFPVMAHFIPGPPDVEEPDQPGKTYTTGVIYADDTVMLNSDLSITVYDPDVVADTLRVTVFNATTGETEYLTLDLISPGMYRNTIRVELKQLRGEDFDGVMNAQPDDVVRVIYQDGRAANGEPLNIVHNARVTSSFRLPELIVRRAVRMTDSIGICLRHSDQQSPAVRLFNPRSGEALVVHLIPQNGNHVASSAVSAFLQGVALGDVLEVLHTYTDPYGAQATLTENVQVKALLQTQGVLTVPENIKPAQNALITLDDPDIITDYVDLTFSGAQSSAFSRIRAYRVAPNTGVYEVEYMLEPKFDNDNRLTVTYADTSAGVAILVQCGLPIERPQAPVDPEEPPTDNTADYVEQMALQIEINGLFTLNGKFSGIVKLYAKEDETVRCSILQAS